jgi:hypothetical protein
MSSSEHLDRSVQGDGNQDDVNKYAESLLSCPVCLERFDDDAVVHGRRAKSLPECRHTFCLPCLRRCCESASGRGVDDFVSAADKRRDFAGRSFPCPTCRRTCRVPDTAGGLDALPNDFRISQVRELLDRMKKATPGMMAARTAKPAAIRRARLAADAPVCSVCQLADDSAAEGDRLAEVKCLTCDRDFCRRCADRHAGNAVFRDHVTSPIERPVKTNEQNDDDDYDDDRRWRCPEHDEPLGYYCAKCERPVCTACVIDVAGGHDQHPVTTRGESAPALRAALTARLQGLDQHIGAVELARRSIEDLKRRREAMHREARDDVARAAVEARRLVDSIENELTTEAQRLHDEDERLVNAADEKLADAERKLREMNRAILQAVERLSVLTSHGGSDSSGGAAAAGGGDGVRRATGLPGFRKFSELVSSSESMTGIDCGLKDSNIPTVPDNLIRGIVATSDVFVRIGSIERQKIDLKATTAAESGRGNLGGQRLNNGKTTTASVATDRSQGNTVGAGVSAGAVADVAVATPRSNAAAVARVAVSPSSNGDRVSHSNKSSSLPNDDDEVPKRDTMQSFASVQLTAGQPTRSASARADNDECAGDRRTQGAMIWESETVEAARSVCFLDRGELIVANCPSDVDRDSPWRRTTTATTATTGKRSGDERLKVFDCTGAVVRQMTGSMVSEPWSVGYDPYGSGGASVVVTERGSTAIKILKTSLSFRCVNALCVRRVFCIEYRAQTCQRSRAIHM